MKTQYTRKQMDRRSARRRQGLGAWRLDRLAGQGFSPLRASGSAIGVIEAPTIDELGLPVKSPDWIVTVYDNDTNTYEQVMAILMIATGCTGEEAFVEAWEIDHLGRSVVHAGSENECREAAEVISKIGIKVLVSED